MKQALNIYLEFGNNLKSDKLLKLAKSFFKHIPTTEFKLSKPSNDVHIISISCDENHFREVIKSEIDFSEKYL